MEFINVYILMAISYLVLWVVSFIGNALTRKKNKFALKIQEVIIAKRIKQFRYPPFSWLIKSWRTKKYLLTSAIFLITIVPVAFIYFLVGLSLFFPLFIVIQGFIVGLLLGNLRGKELLWARLVLIFEFGYWALSGALGFVISLNSLFSSIFFNEAILKGFNIFWLEYGILIIICIIGNALLEVAGPIYFNFKGAVDMEVLEKGKVIQKL